MVEFHVVALSNGLAFTRGRLVITRAAVGCNAGQTATNVHFLGETPALNNAVSTSKKRRLTLLALADRAQRDDHNGDGSEHPDQRLRRAAGQPHLPVLN
jgi:hypothetical protein